MVTRKQKQVQHKGIGIRRRAAEYRRAFEALSVLGGVTDDTFRHLKSEDVKVFPVEFGQPRSRG